MDRRPGCLVGLFKLFLLDTVFKWLQERFGFGRGSVGGFGCGIILLIIFVLLACGVMCGTDWFQFL